MHKIVACNYTFKRKFIMKRIRIRQLFIAFPLLLTAVAYTVGSLYIMKSYILANM